MSHWVPETGPDLNNSFMSCVKIVTLYGKSTQHLGKEKSTYRGKIMPKSEG